MNKILLFSILILLTSCGYSSLNKINKSNFSIVDYQINGDKKLEKYFIRNFDKYKNDLNANRQFKIIIENKIEKVITSKNSAGVANSYSMKIVANTEVFEEDTLIEKKEFSISANYNNLNSKFELGQYEKILIKDLTSQLNDKINFRLSQLNDN